MASPPFQKLIMIGACYVDTILTVPHFPAEDSKLRAQALKKRRGGNIANALEVLQQFDLPTELILLCVLPARSTPGSNLVRASLGARVNTEYCIHREDYEEPASSYIIKSLDNDSRTIVNYNDLPEMSVSEFKDQVANIIGSGTDERAWFHFEGREVPMVIECVRWLRGKYPNIVISVEAEKPNRPMLEELIPHADLVLFSRAWAESKGFDNANNFLTQQAKLAPKAKLLSCTWGENGAAAIRPDDGVLHEVEGAGQPAQTVVDTIGAGDTFTAGLLYVLLRSANDFTEHARGALEFANGLAGKKVLQEGFSGLANADKLDS